VNIVLPKDLKMGSLQGVYSTLMQNAKDYDYFIHKNGVATKIGHLQNQIAGLQAMNQNLVKQKEIQTKEFALAEHDFNRQKQLHTEGVISDMDFEKFQSQLLQQGRQIEATEATFINNDMQIRQIESQISDLSQNKNDNGNTKQVTLAEDIRRTLSAIAEWKKVNLIIAPINGKISLSKVWATKQAVNAGEEVLTIVPAENTEGGKKVFCQATMPIANSGKVKIGQFSTIRFDNFPYQEYGILEGTVQNISLIPQKGKENENYLVRIAVNDSLQTTYKKYLPFQQEMVGSANITTESRRLIARFFDRVNDLLKNRV
jgi:HlyD family secretion protein